MQIHPDYIELLKGTINLMLELLLTNKEEIDLFLVCGSLAH